MKDVIDFSGDGFQPKNDRFFWVIVENAALGSEKIDRGCWDKTRKTQLAAGEAMSDKEDEKGTDKSDSTLYCILIEWLFSYIYFS